MKTRNKTNGSYSLMTKKQIMAQRAINITPAQHELGMIAMGITLIYLSRKMVDADMEIGGIVNFVNQFSQGMTACGVLIASTRQVQNLRNFCNAPKNVTEKKQEQPLEHRQPQAVAVAKPIEIHPAAKRKRGHKKNHEESGSSSLFSRFKAIFSWSSENIDKSNEVDNSSEIDVNTNTEASETKIEEVTSTTHGKKSGHSSAKSHASKKIQHANQNTSKDKTKAKEEERLPPMTTTNTMYAWLDESAVLNRKVPPATVLKSTATQSSVTLTSTAVVPTLSVSQQPEINEQASESSGSESVVNHELEQQLKLTQRENEELKNVVSEFKTKLNQSTVKNQKMQEILRLLDSVMPESKNESDYESIKQLLTILTTVKSTMNTIKAYPDTSAPISHMHGAYTQRSHLAALLSDLMIKLDAEKTPVQQSAPQPGK